MRQYTVVIKATVMVEVHWEVDVEPVMLHVPGKLDRFLSKVD